MSDDRRVVFRRINGRIVPVRTDGAGKDGAPRSNARSGVNAPSASDRKKWENKRDGSRRGKGGPDERMYVERKQTTKERVTNGAIAGAGVGAAVGSFLRSKGLSKGGALKMGIYAGVLAFGAGAAYSGKRLDDNKNFDDGSKRKKSASSVGAAK